MAEPKQIKKLDHKDFVLKEGTVIKYNDRKWIEILVDTKHFRKGQKLNPHSTHANAYIKQEIAKEIPAPKKIKRAKQKTK